MQPVGELDRGASAILDDELRRVEATDAEQIVVDLSELELINSAGLKVLLQANRRCRLAAHELTIVPGPHRVQARFETAGLVSRLPFADCA